MPPRPCQHCGQPIPPGQRCQPCRQQASRTRETTRPTREQRGYDTTWRNLRLTILRRDKWTCRYCGNNAPTVDHITPLAAGGPRLDPTNLQAACLQCNSAKRDRHTPH